MLRMTRLIPALSLFAVTHSLAQTPTWNGDVACIVQSHCAPCHHDGGPGHFDLLTYADGYYWRNEMAYVTAQRLMPPWPPDPTYRSLAHERTLTQDEVDLIAAWVNAGAPVGEGEAPEPPVFTNEPVIDQPDITAVMEEYVIPPSSNDNYRAFVLPITNPTDRYITGIEVIPGNTEMVHHVLVFQDTSGQARVLDEADIEPGYASFGDVGVPEAKLVGIWVPGAEPVFTPPGMGIKLLAGADLVIQVHYPATGTPEMDATRVNIQLSDGGFVRDIAIDPVLDHLFAITDGPLIIPPDQVRTFHAQFTVPLPATITAIGPHAHLIARSMKAFAVVPAGDTIPLIDIPRWDFRWQGLYNFQRPIHLPIGTVLHGEATYDNTAANPNNPNDPPDWVWLGEATTDEMMLFYFAYTLGVPNDTNIVVDDGMHGEHHLGCQPLTQVGSEEGHTGAVFRVWPNPASDVLWMQLPAGSGRIELNDACGRTVRTWNTRDREQLAVGELARGPYMMRCLIGEQTVRTIPVILE